MYKPRITFHLQMLRCYPCRFICFQLAILKVLIDGSSSWPEGTFGLPMPKTGCPVGPVIDWEPGTRTQMTEKGSHSSTVIHLAGIEPNFAEHIVQLFCMKLSYPQDSDYVWMPGKYCIFKKGDCPAKFQEGFIWWDDAVPWYNSKNDHRQSSKGVLPEGEFDRNTKLFYCCRTDGSPYTPIRLPPDAPFYLLKFGDVCQEVEQMAVNEEWVYWSDARSSNVNHQGGTHPKVVRSQIPKIYTKLFYCYYQPKPPSQALQIMMIILYVAAGFIGFSIMMSVVICLFQQVCRHRHKQTNDDDLENTCQTSQPSSEPPRVYRYVTVQTNDEVAPAIPVVPSAPPEFDDPVVGFVLTKEEESNLRWESLPPYYEEVVKK